VDLRDERLIAALTRASISPPRRLNSPYTTSVPFGTDQRTTDAIIAGETEAAETMLRSTLARYSAAELGVQALHATERVLGHPFLNYLKNIDELASRRRRMEDSNTLHVAILGSGIPGGSVADYLGFMDALDGLGSTIAQ
jgi:hypothetical protein